MDYLPGQANKNFKCFFFYFSLRFSLSNYVMKIVGLLLLKSNNSVERLTRNI